MNSQFVLLLVAAVLATALVTSSGCSGGLATGEVQGTVTVDGKPAANVQVMYYPEEGRMSVAVTDGAGHYTLKARPGSDGIPVGSYAVVITSVSEVAPVERLPARYNKKTELTADVMPGQNTIDFELQSK